MKTQAITLIVCLLFGTTSVFAQSSADDITGKWETANKARIIEITKDNNGYKGTITEDKNDKLPAGTVLLKDIQYKSSGTYTGKMAAPKMGREIPCTITMTDANTLSINVSARGRSKTLEWKRLAS
jgi:uncharacterized protein (DUF2147 family)